MLREKTKQQVQNVLRISYETVTGGAPPTATTSVGIDPAMLLVVRFRFSERDDFFGADVTMVRYGAFSV